LLPGGAGVGVVRRPQHRHEHLGAADLPGGGIDHRHWLAGMVHEHAFAARGQLAHRALEPLGPGAVLLAQRALAVGLIAAVAAVLLPQQLQRHAGAVELPVQRGEVG